MNKCLIGIDPGEKGGMACIFYRQSCDGYTDVISDKRIFSCNMPKDENGIVDWLVKIKMFCKCPIDVLVEEIQIRPTHFKRKGSNEQSSSILKSSCVIYGNYRMICGILYALKLTPKVVLPKEWQKYYGLKREKGMSDSKWKNVLKDKAVELFPDIGITLSTSDSLLLANYLYQQNRSNK